MHPLTALPFACLRPPLRARAPLLLQSIPPSPSAITMLVLPGPPSATRARAGIAPTHRPAAPGSLTAPPGDPLDLCRPRRAGAGRGLRAAGHGQRAARRADPQQRGGEKGAGRRRRQEEPMRRGGGGGRGGAQAAACGALPALRVGAKQPGGHNYFGKQMRFQQRRTPRQRPGPPWIFREVHGAIPYLSIRFHAGAFGLLPRHQTQKNFKSCHWQ